MTDKEDLQAASVANPSRRCLFKTAAVGAAGLAVGAAGGYLVSQQNNTANAGHSTQSIDCHGAHQAGILNPAHQPCGIFTAFDITGKTRGELQKLFRIITDRIEFLTKGGRYPDAHPQLPPAGSGIIGVNVPPDELTITVSLGSSVFDERFGLAALKPKHLQAMMRFPNDMLRAEYCHGDFSLQFCADNHETNMHALRDIMKALTGLAVVRWSIDGFLPKGEPGAAPRNLLGFKDGSANPKPKQADDFLWTGLSANSQGEPAWAKGGTYQAVRLIRNLVEFWDRTPLKEQEMIFGRDKAHGAPLGMKGEYDEPDYSKDTDGKKIPMDAHMRLANPRTKDTQKSLMLRRPYNYSLGLQKSGQLDVGLVFICYQANLQDGFIDVQKRLDGEPLEEYIKPFGGGFFFTLPGFKKGEFVGQSLLMAAEQLA